MELRVTILRESLHLPLEFSVQEFVKIFRITEIQTRLSRDSRCKSGTQEGVILASACPALYYFANAHLVPEEK